MLRQQPRAVRNISSSNNIYLYKERTSSVLEFPWRPRATLTCRRSQPSIRRSDDRGSLTRPRRRRGAATHRISRTGRAGTTQRGGKPGDRIKTGAAPRDLPPGPAPPRFLSLPRRSARSSAQRNPPSSAAAPPGFGTLLPSALLVLWFPRIGAARAGFAVDFGVLFSRR